MKKLALLVISLMIIPVTGRSQENVPMGDDGYTWTTQLTMTDKIDYVHAYAIGYFDGFLDGFLKAKPGAPSLPIPQFMPHGKTPRTIQIILGVDELYKNPAYRPICINHAVLSVLIKLTHPNTRQELDQTSKTDAEIGCK